MFDRASHAVSNALHLLDKAKATTSAIIKAAALHVKSLCNDGSIQLQRESQNQVLRNEFKIVSVESMMKQLNHVLDHFDDASALSSFCYDNDMTFCALQSLEFALRYPEKDSLDSLIFVVSQLLENGITDCVVLCIIAHTLVLMKSQDMLTGCSSTIERCISLWKKNCVWKKSDDDDDDDDNMKIETLLYASYLRTLPSHLTFTYTYTHIHRYGFHFEACLPPTISSRTIRRLRLRIGNDYYGSMRWRIFVEGNSLQLYISSVEITLDPTLFDNYVRVLKHEPYEVVGIGKRSFSFHVKVNFKKNTARHFSTRCIVNLDQSRTDRSFVVVV